MNDPTTLQDAIIYFSDPDRALNYFAQHRWPNGPYCPECGRADPTFLPTQRKWQCKSRHDHRQFSVKVGTIFEDSPLGLDKWLTVAWMIANDKNGVSSYEIAKAIGVTQKTAWFMLHRIRKAMQTGSFLKKFGSGGSEVEADETFIGGRGVNMHKSRKLRLNQVRSEQRGAQIYPGKTAVMGLLDREQRKVVATVIPDLKRDTLQGIVLNAVTEGTKFYTDQQAAYDGLDKHYIHEIVNHMEEYVRGRVHCNGMENFWSLLKRTLKGTYVAVEPYHLDRYLAEQVFRYNNRKTKDQNVNDADRFQRVLSQVADKRLTYAELTGKAGERAAL